MHKLKISALATLIGLLSLASTPILAADGATVYAKCLGCHGPNGNSVAPIFPKLAGQNEEYLLNQLKDIKSGARTGGQTAMMVGIVAGVSDEEMAAVTQWLSEQP